MSSKTSDLICNGVRFQVEARFPATKLITLVIRLIHVEQYGNHVCSHKGTDIRLVCLLLIRFLLCASGNLNQDFVKQSGLSIFCASLANSSE